ncbi:MAG: sigma-54 dependent transcriptional regulator [Candidatus Cloacimonetes bacterium]|nr:sigma-54 dependent transcriptional regulator [Candidatus Cloacimonadota bacterium]
MTDNRLTILVVDDSIDSLEMISRKLKKRDFSVFTATNVADALSVLEKTDIDLVITDFKMPKVSGLELIRHINENYKQLKVVMITGYPTIDGAVEAVKSGAEEYLIKPFTDEELYKAIDEVVEKIRTESLTEVTQIPDTYQSYGLIGNSQSMNTVFHAIERSTAIYATVLITGESGTGKELVARAIHYHSPRSAAPFVAVNCGAIPENLLESELFGFMKGAFTGAHETRAGFFIIADGGTIFLDEISETSLSMQVKLLRVLQDKQVSMIGAKQSRKVDVRIIAATNKNLAKLVDQGHFREDLFYRLNVITIDLPPLRERNDDVIILTKYFLEKYAKEIGKKTPTLTENAFLALKNYSWPGNVRELENFAHRLVIMIDHPTIDVPDLPEAMRYCIQVDKDYTKSLKDMEAEYIRNVLASVEGNKSKAAQILGIDRKTLRSKLPDKDEE